MRTMRVRAVLASVALCVLTLSGTPGAGAAGVENNAAAALFNKINNKRVKAQNLHRLEEWQVIVDEARDHSAHQAQQGRIGHDGFDGRASRIRAAGTGINGVCENVATVSGVNDIKAVVRIIYRGWDRSPGHHACMFDKDFRGTWGGVGVKRVGSTWYATFLEAQDSSPGQP